MSCLSTKLAQATPVASARAVYRAPACLSAMPTVAAPIACRVEAASVKAARGNTIARRATGNGVTAADKADAKAVPIVKIDNHSDAFATVVSVEFGNKLGELLDTITSLKNLGLNIRRAKLDQRTAANNSNTFYITDAATSEKVLKSARLEEIRMTIINNMMYYHPESKEQLASYQPAQRDSTSPLGMRRRAVTPTVIEVVEAPNGSCSVLKLTTRDRPGLLVDVVSVLKDINVNVVSAEIDTVGDQARDELFVTYHGEPLPAPMVQLVNNALQYYLSLAEVEKEESY